MIMQTQEKELKMEDQIVQTAKAFVENISKGRCYQFEALAVEGIRVLEARRGFLRCIFVVSDRLSDGNENWHVGAMTTLVDDVGAVAVFSFAGDIKASLDFSISFFSNAKIHEEVEIEAKVVGDKGKITSVVIEVKRKGNGELIALGKQWMATKKVKLISSKL